jgi:hypothetical protein
MFEELQVARQVPSDLESLWRVSFAMVLFLFF